MGEWKECELGDIVTFQRGFDITRKEQNPGKYPVVSSSGIKSYHNVFKVKKPGVVIGRKGTLGTVFYLDTDFWPHDTSLWVKNFHGNNPLFIYYFLKGFDLEHYDVGSSNPTLNRNHIHHLPTTIPDFSEQKAIASVLSSLDDKIDLLHRQNKTLEAMAETLFRQWFVEQARDDWVEGCLGDAIELFDHLRVPLSKTERDKRKTGKLYPYYGAAKIMDYINDYIFDGEYILLGEDGTVRTEEGFPILQYATGKFWVNNHTHVIKAKKPYSNFFIWNYLKKKNIDEIVTGAVQPKINQGNLKSLDFPNYPKDLVENFNCQTEPLFKKINQNNTQSRTLEKLRDTLLPKLMSGEIRVEYEH
jgi:type I restriction enzyme, S subunit